VRRKPLSEKREAWSGYIEPLRKYVSQIDPDLVPFILLPKLKQGQRFFRHEPKWDAMVFLAAAYVWKINDLWVETYNKKHRKFAPTALNIAAKMCSVEEEDVIAYLKERPRRHYYRRAAVRVRRRQGPSGIVGA